MIIDPARAPRSHREITAYLTHLTRLGRAASTIDTYADLLCRLDATLPEGLAYACADELETHIYSGCRAKATTALYRAAATGFFRWATDPAAPRLDYDPTRRLPTVHVPRRHPRPVPDNVLADVLSRAAQPYRLWYRLAAGMGLRACEISRLDREDVTETATYVRGKGGKERMVPTHPAVWDMVRTMPRGPVARRYYDQGRATRKDIYMRGNRHLTVLGYPDVTMHMLRHWFGTAVYRASRKDLRVAQELLGHSSPAITQVYVATDSDVASAAVRALMI